MFTLWASNMAMGNLTNLHIQNFHLPSGKHTSNYGKSSFLMCKSTISMAIKNWSFFHAYGSLPQYKITSRFDPLHWMPPASELRLFQYNPCRKQGDLCTNIAKTWRKNHGTPLLYYFFGVICRFHGKSHY
jgi:hypothetical protein